MTAEVFISVDVETSGPIPGEFSLLTIGACDLDDTTSFACSLKPVGDGADPEALRVSGLSMADLAEDGLAPEVAMASFEAWVRSVVGENRTPVLVGFNAPFDWSFVNYYFHKFLGRNPFGFTALDIKAYYMGVTGCAWSKTKSSVVARHLEPKLKGNHNALQDARYQAELFRLARGLHQREAGEHLL